jgi:hypothetical protein
LVDFLSGSLTSTTTTTTTPSTTSNLHNNFNNNPSNNHNDGKLVFLSFFLMLTFFLFPVGPGLLGRVVNALGDPIDGKGSIENVVVPLRRPPVSFLVVPSTSL